MLIPEVQDGAYKRLFEKLFLTLVVGMNPPKSPLKRGPKIRFPLFKGARGIF
jgi:hypothetical protein